VVKDYYAELPIAVKVTGQLSRHRRVHGRHRQPVAHRHVEQPVDRAECRQGQAPVRCRLEATAKTYRYLDPEEVAAQRAAAQQKAKK
jgi:type IV pilus assembly protein PilO